MIDTTRENVESLVRGGLQATQRQIDEDGVLIGVSRQAVDEAAALLLALVERAENGEAMLSTMRPFFEKHALGPKAKPSCLVCGRNDYESVAIQHMELPGIVVCALCKKAEADLARVTAERDACSMSSNAYKCELEALKQDAERYRKCRRNDGFYFSSDRMTDDEIDARIDNLDDAARKP